MTKHLLDHSTRSGHRRHHRAAALALLAMGAAAFAIVPSGRGNAAAAPAKVTLTFDSKATKLTGFPATLPGGLTTVSLTGGTFGVNLALGRFTGNRTDAELKAAAQGEEIPTWLTLYGGTAGGARAGVTRTATINFDKGSYVWVVMSDDEELSGKQPWGRFTVTGPKSATAPTGGTAKVSTKDYGFDFTGLKAGANSITYANTGNEWHHVIMLKLKAGKTQADLMKAMETESLFPTVVDVTSIASLPAVSPGLTQVADVQLAKGSYVFACFLPDKTGAPHITKGMLKEVKIA